MSSRRRTFFVALGIAFLALGCTRKPETVTTDAKPAGPPEPTVTHTSADAQPGEKIEHGELILTPDAAKQKLHAQHHPFKVLETRRVPGKWTAPAMNRVSDFAVKKGDLDVINPGPGEYVNVMEGQRHGYRNLTIGITWTAPGGAPPMHTHQGEESHVLTSDQRVMYALGDSVFVLQGPYIVNIPPMTPHSFQNLDKDVAELVVIFPTNVWEYDVLDHFPFNTPEAKALAEQAKAEAATATP